MCGPTPAATRCSASSRWSRRSRRPISARPRTAARTAPAMADGSPADGSPAVIGLLAKRPPRVLYYATLLDLAARGWFQLRFPAGSPDDAADRAEAPGGAAQAEPVMCVLAAEPPGGTLTPCEQRVLAVMASRAG